MRPLPNAILAFLILLMVGFPVSAAPWELRGGEDVIEKQQVIEGDLIFSGETLEIDGEVRGDLVVFARVVTVRGRVDGSVLGVVTDDLTVEGEVTGNIRVLASNLGVGGKVGRSVSAYALRLVTGRSSEIGIGILGSYAELKLTGVINGPVDVRVFSRNQIGGRIGSNLTSRGAPIDWIAPVRIDGRVDDYYTVSSQPVANRRIQIAKGYHHRPAKVEVPSAYRFLLLLSVIWFLGSLLMTLIFYRLFPVTAWRMAQPSAQNLQRSFLIGLITLMAVPVACVLLIMTTVGLPIAIILFLIYLVLLIFSAVPFSIFMGRVVFRQAGNSQPLRPNLLVITGSLVASIVSVVPVLGVIVPTCLGVGMIVRSVRPEFKEVRQEIRD